MLAVNAVLALQRGQDPGDADQIERAPDRAAGQGQADGAGGFEQGIGHRKGAHGVREGRRIGQIPRQRYCEVCIDDGVTDRQAIKPKIQRQPVGERRRQVLVLAGRFIKRHDREARRQPCSRRPGAFAVIKRAAD